MGDEDDASRDGLRFSSVGVPTHARAGRVQRHTIHQGSTLIHLGKLRGSRGWAEEACAAEAERRRATAQAARAKVFIGVSVDIARVTGVKGEVCRILYKKNTF